MSIMKHVGKYGEKPCLVLFREVPNEPENCLVVMTGSLEDRDHDDLMNVINSPEAQQAKEVSEVLHRRDFTHGENMLNFLHASGKITKVPVSHVSLTPTPAQSVPLADVNAEIRKLENDPVPDVTDPSHLQELDPNAERQPFESPNPITKQQIAAQDPSQEGGDDKAAIAESMEIQAELMLEEGKKMVEEAKAKKKEAATLKKEAAKEAKAQDK